MNESPAPVLVGKSSSAAAMLSQHFYDDYDQVEVRIVNRSPQQFDQFLQAPAGGQGEELWSSGRISKHAVLGTDHYLRLEQQSYAEMFPNGVPERDQLYGTHLVVEYALFKDGQPATLNNFPLRFNDNFYVNRWIDGTESQEDGKKYTTAYLDNDTGKLVVEKEINLFLPESVTAELGIGEELQNNTSIGIANDVSNAVLKSVIDLTGELEDLGTEELKIPITVASNGIYSGVAKNELPNLLEDLKEEAEWYWDRARDFVGANPDRESGLEPWEVRDNGYHERQRQWALSVITENASYIFDAALAYNVTPDAIAGAILWEALENPYNTWSRGKVPAGTLTRPGGPMTYYGIAGKVHIEEGSEAALVEPIVAARRPEVIRTSDSAIEVPITLGNPITEEELGSVLVSPDFLNDQQYRTLLLLSDPTLAIEYTAAIMGRNAQIYEDLVYGVTAADTPGNPGGLLPPRSINLRDQAGILGIFHQAGFNSTFQQRVVNNFSNNYSHTPGFAEDEEALGPWVSEYRWWFRRLLAAYGSPPYRFEVGETPTPGSVDDVEIPYQFRLQPYQIW
ncbi:hypothetical protein HC928_19675 [bacterium]|nr:hypothetical protein [bacterium]